MTVIPGLDPGIFLMTLNTLKTKIIENLSKTSPSPKLDAEVLLMHCLNFSKTELLLKRDY